jgi:PAS domain S-box-containing protein
MATGVSHYGEGDLLSVPGIRKDGQRISLEFTVVQLKDEQGQMQGIAAVMRDVTSRFAELKSPKQKLVEAAASSDTR